MYVAAFYLFYHACSVSFLLFVLLAATFRNFPTAPMIEETRVPANRGIGLTGR